MCRSKFCRLFYVENKGKLITAFALCRDTYRQWEKDIGYYECVWYGGGKKGRKTTIKQDKQAKFIHV